MIEEDSAPRERCAEDVAPDTSGREQPTDTGDRLHADNQDVIEDNSAPRERSAEEVAPDTVLRANIEDAIENRSL